VQAAYTALQGAQQEASGVYTQLSGFIGGLPAEAAAPYEELQQQLLVSQGENASRDASNVTRGGAVEGQQAIALPQYIQMQEDNAQQSLNYVQQNPQATPEEKAEATAQYASAMADVKYMRDNPQATEVQNRLFAFNDPKGMAERTNLENRGKETATTDALGIAKLTGFSSDAEEQNAKRRNDLNSQYIHTQRAFDINAQALAQDPENPHLKKRDQMYRGKIADIDNEYKTIGPSGTETALYTAGTLPSPEDASETYGLNKVVKKPLKVAGSTAKAGYSAAKGRAAQLRKLIPSSAPVRKTAEKVTKAAAPLVSRAGKLIAPAGKLIAPAGKLIGAAGKLIAPLAVADATVSGSKAAWGDSAESEALRDIHRREADAGESLAFMTKRAPGQNKGLYALQETIKAVDPARAAAQLGTLGRDIGTTAGEYIEADAATKAAMREGIKESLNNNTFYKATGGEKGWAQDVADYYAGPDWTKEDTYEPADPATRRRIKQMHINRARIKREKAQERERAKPPAPEFTNKNPAVMKRMQNAKATANNRTPGKV
jgi:hypothetical protein